jgi:putative FmdB family regulatory protein
MLLFDYKCSSCGNTSEELVPSDETTLVCPKCRGEMSRVFCSVPHVCVETVPDYPGSKARKAGYQHTTYAPQAATKIQSGYGGCQGPKN